MPLSNVPCSLASIISHDKFSYILGKRGPLKTCLEYFRNRLIRSKVSTIGLNMTMVQDIMEFICRQASSIDPISIQLVKEMLFSHSIWYQKGISFFIGRTILEVAPVHFEVDQISIPWGGLVGNGEELLIGKGVINGKLFTRRSLGA